MARPADTLLLTGALVGCVLRSAEDGFKYRAELELDDDGNYLPQFVVHAPSGDYQVTVAPMPSLMERVKAMYEDLGEPA